MPHKLCPTCLVCGEAVFYLEEEEARVCGLCGQEFEAVSTCANQHNVCHTCRQKAARQAMIEHCLASSLDQPFPLMLELMKLPGTAMHGPEHHLLLTAALLTAYCNAKDRRSLLPDYLAEANERSMDVPGGACGYWGICGAAIGSGIAVSIIAGADPFAREEWKTAGQLTARCANTVSRQGGPRCCKRDSFLSLIEAVRYSNEILGTAFSLPTGLRCEFYPNNEECKGPACPFFPVNQQ